MDLPAFKQHPFSAQEEFGMAQPVLRLSKETVPMDSNGMDISASAPVLSLAHQVTAWLMETVLSPPLLSAPKEYGMDQLALLLKLEPVLLVQF